jgi:ABC-type sugar transport system substrate-binding protein
VASLTLALAMLIALVAPSAAADFKWNGKKEVWAVVPTTNAEGLMVICNSMGKKMQAQGWTYVAKDAQGDPGKQVTFVEDAIASKKVGALMVAAMSVDMLKDIIEKAGKAGIVVGYLGALPKNYKINTAIYTAYEITGMFAIEMVEAWVKENKPKAGSDGKIPVALDVYDDIEDGQYRSNAFRDRTKESKILSVFNTSVSYGKDAQNKGYNWAENMMTKNPNLRVFVCYEPDCMVGVVSFLAKYAKSKNLDLKDFCVVNCYEDTATREELKKAQANASATAFKGYVTYGAAPNITGEKMAELLLDSASGKWKFGEVYYDVINSHAAFKFVKNWKMGEPNPALRYKR